MLPITGSVYRILYWRISSRPKCIRKGRFGVIVQKMQATPSASVTFDVVGAKPEASFVGTQNSYLIDQPRVNVILTALPS